MMSTAIAVMIGATLAHHLGLTEAVAKVASNVLMKVASCNMCCSFWLCLFVLIIEGEAPIFAALMLSILAAYASNWFVLLLVLSQQIYNSIWQRLSKGR